MQVNYCAVAVADRRVRLLGFSRGAAAQRHRRRSEDDTCVYRCDPVLTGIQRLRPRHLHDNPFYLPTWGRIPAEHSRLVEQVYADRLDWTSLTVTWSGPLDSNGAEVSSYNVELSPSADAWLEPYINVTISATAAADMAGPVREGDNTHAATVSLKDAGLICGEAWFVRVRAVNEMGQGPPEWYSIVVSSKKAGCLIHKP